MNYEVEEMKIRLEVLETARIMLIAELKPNTPTYDQIMSRAQDLMYFIKNEKEVSIRQVLTEADTQVGC